MYKLNLSAPAYDIPVITPLCSPRTGEAVRNQYTIYNGRTTVFQSYSTICAVFDKSDKTLAIFPAAFYASRTTSRYFAQFLREECNLSGENVKELRKIADNTVFTDSTPLFVQV